MTLGVPGSLGPNTQICVRCLMDETVPGVQFDRNGICNHCHIHDKLEEVYPLGEEGKRRIHRIADQIRKDGKGNKYDCVVGVSGGRDTSYCLYVAVRELGLRPLAAHFDNGWDSDIAKSNLRKLCNSLDVDLHTTIADWDESRDLTNCTIRASVPYIDLTDDVGIAGTLYRAAERENIRYVLSSHSFREEGITPVKWMYIDGLYVRSIIKQFSKMPAYTQFPKELEVDLHHMLYWIFAKRIKIVNLSNYYDDVGQKVEQTLAEECGWVDTYQHHFDNEIFALVYHYARHKFGIDWRIIELSAKIRTGAVTRDEALAELEKLPVFETEELLSYCLKKQGFDRDEYEELLTAPRKYWTEYPNYYRFFRWFKYPIKIAGRLDIIPGHSYEKFFET
jgi:N-acetyl sugar amidotransferase